MEKNGGEVICEQSDMEEFYKHGLSILDWFKKRDRITLVKKVMS